MVAMIVALLFIASAWTNAVAVARSNEADGVRIIVVSPEPGATVDSGPVVVALDVTLVSGPGAERVREDPKNWHVCYALNGTQTARSFPIVKPESTTPWATLPPIEDPMLLVPGSRHTFKAWVEHGACNTHPIPAVDTGVGPEASHELHVAGFTSHTFHVRRKVSAHAARLAQWERQVAALTDSRRRPAFIEIGTSYFDTLAEKHAADSSALWVGTSVEPVPRYLASLPTRDGLTKVNALVCPNGASSSSTLYSLDAALLDKHGMDQFFHGMSSTDPTHLWRSPQFRSRVPLALYRNMLTSTEVPCVSYADLIDPLNHASSTSTSTPGNCGGAVLSVLPPQSSPSFKRPKKALVGGHRVREKAAREHAGAVAATNILAHLKVDAEGADVAIVLAAVEVAQRTCAWPWRIDFEAAHLHHAATAATAAEMETAATDSRNHPSSKHEYPSAFTLSGFPESASASVLDPRNADGEDYVFDTSKYPAFESEKSANLGAADSLSGDVPAKAAASEALPTINGRFVKVTGRIGGAPAYAHENGLWWCAFVFELGHWVIHAPSLANGSMLGGVAAHTDAGFQWALPWEANAPWRGLSSRMADGNERGGTEWRQFEGTSAVAEFGPPVCKVDETSRRHRTQRQGDCVVAGEEESEINNENNSSTGAGSTSGMTSEALMLELEDFGYACSCDSLDCTCFTTPRRIAAHHPKCAPFVQLSS